MAGVFDLSMRCGLHPCSAHKRRRVVMPSLPKDIIFKILLCLPADIIYNVMRFVCRAWYDIIKDPIFIDAHLQESPSGFLVQVFLRRYSTLYVEMGKNSIGISDLNLSQEGMGDIKGSWFWPPHHFSQYEEIKRVIRSIKRVNPKFPGRVLSSCRGLVLVSDLRFRNCLHVANLLSNQWMKLPPLRAHSTPRTCAGLAYAAACKAYKVAYTYYIGRDCFCGILTLGADKAWRYIFSGKDISCIPRKVDKKDLFMSRPYSVGGYIHWVCPGYVLSLEVETENFHVSVTPKEFSWKYKSLKFLPAESYLFFVAVRRKYIWELWALTKVETGEWTMLQEIDLNAQKPVLELRFGQCGYNLKPVGLLRNGELVMFKFFRIAENLLMYNAKTGEIDFHQFEKNNMGGVFSCSNHAKSLVSLEYAL